MTSRTSAPTLREPKVPPAPRTLAATHTLSGRRSAPTSEFPLSHLALSWSGGMALVRTRTESGWSDWSIAVGCDGAPDRKSGETKAALLVVPGAIGYEVQLDSPAATATVTEMDTTGGSTASAATLAGERAAAAASSMPLPDGTSVNVPFLNRPAWGADESIRYINGVETWPPLYAPVQTISVHHTATANGVSDPAGVVRAIYDDQTRIRDGGWGDIGYNLLIDEAGVVYEGRWSGPDPVPAFSGSAVADLVTGGHIRGYNLGNIGVCLIGNLTSRMPTSAAYTSLVRVLTGLVRVCRLIPQGEVDYYNPVTALGNHVFTISGHRDWAATSCPGDTFYPDLPNIRQSVAAMLPPPEVPDGRRIVTNPPPPPALPSRANMIRLAGPPPKP